MFLPKYLVFLNTCSCILPLWLIVVGFIYTQISWTIHSFKPHKWRKFIASCAALDNCYLEHWNEYIVRLWLIHFILFPSALLEYYSQVRGFELGANHNRYLWNVHIWQEYINNIIQVTAVATRWAWVTSRRPWRTTFQAFTCTAWWLATPSLKTPRMGFSCRSTNKLNWLVKRSRMTRSSKTGLCMFQFEITYLVFEGL